MYCLQRNVGEWVKIGNSIRIGIGAVSGESVELTIDVPDDVSVWREEIYHALQADFAEDQDDNLTAFLAMLEPTDVPPDRI